MATDSEGTSFYFFDFDDNVMFLSTSILILNTITEETKELTTGEFANVHPSLGQPGDWEDWAVFDGSFKNFRDIPESELEDGQRQQFVRDITSAIQASESSWKAPAWPLFVHACNRQRPVAIVTARGHSPDTIRAGIRVLAAHGLIEREPNYLSIFPVSNEAVRRDQLGDPNLVVTTPALKKRAIIQAVDRALERYGDGPEHRFGMSDDDPKNVHLIVSAMAECKKTYLDKRFFVISTHLGEKVKLEVFPVDFPVTGRPARVLAKSGT